MLGKTIIFTDGELLRIFSTAVTMMPWNCLCAATLHGVGRVPTHPADHHDAEEAFQASFLILVRKAASIVPREKLVNWLYGVAYHTATAARRTRAKRKLREQNVVNLPEQPVSAEEKLSHWQADFDIEISRLPEKIRTVILLCSLQGDTMAEVPGTSACRKER